MTNKRYIAGLYHHDKMVRRDITVEDIYYKHSKMKRYFIIHTKNILFHKSLSTDPPLLCIQYIVNKEKERRVT